jgi:mannosyltransferase
MHHSPATPAMHTHHAYPDSDRHSLSATTPIENKRSVDTSAWVTQDSMWMLLMVCIALAARLFRIGSQPFWLDEALTFQRIHLDFGGLIADSFTNRHMPSYFLMLQLISKLSSSDTLLRLPSAFFGALSTGMVFSITWRIGRRSAAIVAGVLMALSPLQVQYGQEARSYTLVTLLITVALWGLLKLAQNPARASLGLRYGYFDRYGWGAYVFGTIGALDVLSDAAPWLIAANVALFLIWRDLHKPSSCEAQMAFRRNWLLSSAVILVCCAPFYSAILAASDGQMLQKFNWIPPLSWRNLRITAKSAYLMRMAAVVRFNLLPTAVPMLGPLVGVLGVVGLWRMRERLDGRVLWLGLLILPLLLLAISSFQPMVLPRYVLWSAAPFFVLAGIGAATLPRRILPVAVITLTVLCAVNLAPVYQLETKPRWDMAAATLAANVRPGDTIFTGDTNAPTMLSVLQPKDAPPIEQTALVTPWLDVALARSKQGSRVWAVNGRSALGPREDLDAFKDRTAVLGTPTLEIPQGDEITILMFPAPAPTATD